LTNGFSYIDSDKGQYVLAAYLVLGQCVILLTVGVYLLVWERACLFAWIYLCVCVCVCYVTGGKQASVTSQI